MLATLQTHLLPTLTTPEQLAGGVVVVLDILRASTTITTALVNGATSVIPCFEIAAAQQTAGKFERTQVLLGGERNGLPIAGFDLGNSPCEYQPSVVQQKRVIFTTTNGTRAMQQCRLASEVLIGSFVNLSAVCEHLLQGNSKRPIHLLCAGTSGQITREDVLCAGAITERLWHAAMDETTLNDQGRLALDAWLAVMRQSQQVQPLNWSRFNTTQRNEQIKIDRQNLTQVLAETQGGRNLRALGLASDLPWAADLDRYQLVPVLDLKSWEIR